MRLSAIILCAVTLLADARAERSDDPAFGIESAEALELIEIGRRHAFATHFDAADQAFRAAYRVGGGAAAYLQLSTTALVRLLLSDRKELYDTFFERSDSVRALLDRQPSGRWKQFVDAENDLLRSLAWAKRSRYTQATMAAVSAYGTYDSLVEDYPEFAEPYAGLGAINATIGAITPPFGYVMFAVKAAAQDIRMGDIFRASWLFVGLTLIGMAVMTIFPDIVTFLPSLME